MAKNKNTKEKSPKITTQNEQSNDLVAKLLREYDEANATLTERINHKKNGFDAMDRLYQTYINPERWPYSVVLPTPRGFTALFNKGTRMVGGRLTGKVEPQEMSDEIGAKIGTEHFKWSVNRYNQYSDRPVESEIFMSDQNARLYGGGFGFVYWRTEYKNIPDKDGNKKAVKVYDNWFLDTLNNRDVLFQPGRETIRQSDYVIIRRYFSYEELERIQMDGEPYDKTALAELKKAKEGTGRNNNYDSVVNTVRGLSDNDKRFEICTTYYKDRWITWCPKKGSKNKKNALILRDISNPYRHQEIPIAPLVYIPSEEDIYGMSELQPVSALLKILSALQSQFVEMVNLELYAPIMADATETRLDTWKYKPKAIWLVNNPDKVKDFQKGNQSLAKFSEVYKMVVTEFLEAMGEMGTGVSQTDLLGGDKTATEVKDRAYLRGARDNFNKIMLSAYLKKIMYFAFEMLRDPKFTDKNTIIKIVGKEALEYFDKKGFSSWGINDTGYELVSEVADSLSQNPDIKPILDETGQSAFDLAYELLMADGALDEYAEPLNPVATAKGVVSKLQLSEDEQHTGYLYADPEEDYLGNFNFIPDIEALGLPDSTGEYQARASWYEQAKIAEKDGSLTNEGYRLKHKDILSKLGELAKVREAEQYFEKIEAQEEIPNATNQRGEANQGIGPGSEGVPGEQGVQIAPNQAQPGVGQAIS